MEKGFASEAVKALLNYGFKTLKLHRIEAGVATENVNSIKLLEKTGMQREECIGKYYPLEENGMIITAMRFWRMIF